MSQRLEVFVLYDRIGGFYEQPFFSPNRGCVMRTLVDLKHSGQSSNILLHSSDYEIYSIGFYLSDRGVLEPLTKPDFWCRVSDIIEESEAGAAVGVQPPQVPEAE